MKAEARSRAVHLAAGLGVSATGGVIAHAWGFPAGLLVGGALASAIGALAGLKPQYPNLLKNAVFLIIGMALGTNVSQDALTLLPQWPVTIVGLMIVLAVTIGGTGWVLQRFFGLDRGTAYLSAFPGHLSFVLAIAESGAGDSRKIGVIQTVRILLLTLLVPLVVRFAVPEASAGVAVREVMSPLPLALLGAACLGAGLLFARLRIPAAFVLGPMAVATIAKLLGLYEGVLPQPFVWFSFIFMGGLIGSRFSGVSLRELARAGTGGLAVTTIAVAMVSAVAAVGAQLTALPFGQIWLGLAPGALEAMGALGIALGYDTAFVAGHHTIRLFVLSVIMPVMLWVIRRGPKDTAPAD